MAKHKSPVQAPAASSSNPVDTKAPAAKPERKLEKYYRIRKHSGFLYDVVEVEVDETITPPKAVTKQDCKELIQDRIVPFVLGEFGKRK